MQERQTKQKQIIYDALKTLDHPTATEVYGYLHESYPSVSRATVFRVLGGFAAGGKALELRAAGDETRYDYNVMPHYHARCLQCGKVADVEATGVPTEALAITADHGFSVEGYSVEFFGKCPTCQKKS
ncbi:MAG: transcriptional repressor [Clostridia bacterium]|nr:transcriptional repressor [Clostridia bacterium]MBQ9714768.1 transcriptional repressor [Clostridia bacterium]